MAKAFRTAPLQADSTVGLPILNSRERKAMRRLGVLVGRLDDNFIYEAAVEIGLDECIIEPERDGAMSFDLTPLQAVSLCAALSALVELRDSAGI